MGCIENMECSKVSGACFLSLIYRYLKKLPEKHNDRIQLNGLAHLYFHPLIPTPLYTDPDRIIDGIAESIKEECTSEICVILTKLTDKFVQTLYLL